MSRLRRFRARAGESYHIIVRSISELSLFRCDADKDHYLSLIKKYQMLYRFEVYAYCIMTTHAHMMIDDKGASISDIMRRINLSYVQYYNRKYHRHGHLFQDRFKSTIVDKDPYLMKLSAYIHRNPKDIKGYKDTLENYRYSSLSIYLGLLEDTHDIISTQKVLLHFSTDPIRAKILYKNFVDITKNMESEIDPELLKIKGEYKSEKSYIVRNFKPEQVINFAAKYLMMNPNCIKIKRNHTITNFKALCVVLLNSFCNYSLKMICEIMGNVTLSTISRLYSKGILALNAKIEYAHVIEDFLLIETPPL